MITRVVCCLAHALFTGLLLLTLLAPLLQVFVAVLLDLPPDGLFVKAEQVAALLGVNATGNLVRDQGDGFHHIGDGCGALDGIVLCVLEYNA